MKRFFTYAARYGDGIETGFRYLFVILFVYAGMSKLLDFETFRVQLAQSPLLSAYAEFVAWAVPLSEFLIAILLLIDRTRVWGLSGFFFLMVMFTTYIIIILNFADFVPCSCGGVLEKMSWGQHLVFNIAFVLVSGVLLYFQFPGNWRRRVLFLGSQVVLGVGLVSVLFAFSEKKMHRNNAFQRRYVPHPVEKERWIDLKMNSYYLAGIDSKKVYLGNVTAPLHIQSLDMNLITKEEKEISISNLGHRFRAPIIQITPPFFNFSDGTVPVIFSGNISNWHTNIEHSPSGYFSLITPMENRVFAIRARDHKTNENVLGKLQTGDSSSISLYHHILEKQIDGVFDTDGKLLFNRQLGKLIYVYFYRNEFIVLDEDFKIDYHGRTIDTVSIADLKINYLPSKNAYTMGASPLVVNRNAATFGHYLFVQSDRPGRYESTKLWKKTAVIDVYDLETQYYKFSFHIENQGNDRLREFIINKNTFIGLIGNHLVKYVLNERLFPFD